MRSLWRGSLFLLHLCGGALLTVLIAPFQRPDRPYPASGIRQWWHRRLCRLLGLELRVLGARPSTPVLIVANHVSWLDIPVLGSLAPVSFVSKQEVRHWPLVGWLAARSETLFIQRGNGQIEQLKQQMQERMALGNRVVLFPEGTTSNGESVRPFFPRLFAIAQETGRPLQPVALRYREQGELSRAAPYIDNDTVVVSFLRILRQKKIEVEVTFTAPLEGLDRDRKTLAREARERILAALGTGAIN